MKKFTLLLAVIACCFTACFFATPTFAEETKPAASTPTELLDLIVGEWAEEVTMPDGKVVKGTTKIRKVLGGKFVEMEAEIPVAEGQTVLHLSLLTYDEKSQEFRGWMFNPTGLPFESTASYDAAAGVMKGTSKPSAQGMVLSTVEKYIGKDRIEWIAEGKNAEGAVVFKISGVNTRKK